MYSIRYRLAIGFALVMGLTLALLLIAVHRGAVRIVEEDAVAALRTEVTLHRVRWQQQSAALRRAAGRAMSMADRPERWPGRWPGRSYADLELDGVMIVGSDGLTVLYGARPSVRERQVLIRAVSRGDVQGIAMVRGVPMQVAALPLTNLPLTSPAPASPALAIPARSLTALAKPGGTLLALRHIPLDTGVAGMPQARILPVAILDPAIFDGDQPLRAQGALVHAIRLQGFGPAPERALLIQHPLGTAFAMFRRVEQALAAIGIGSLLAALLAGWYLARDLTRPILVLRDAARRVAAGENEQVWIGGRDEISDLATSFNMMVAAVTEREARIAHLYRLACHDPMTGLPNRAALHEALTARLFDAESGGAQDGGLFYIDIDDLRHVNERLGHGAGDRLLRLFAERSAGVLDGALLARIGGDEFAALVPGDWIALRRTAQALVVAAAQPFDIDGHSVRIGASVGIALLGIDGHNPDRLLHHADVALHAAKASGKARCCFYREGPHAGMLVRSGLDGLKVVHV